jgi:anti-sigma B factor antagonist
MIDGTKIGFAAGVRSSPTIAVRRVQKRGPLRWFQSDERENDVTTDWQSSASVEATDAPDGLVLRLSGELDAASRDLVEPAVMAAIASAAAVTLDLGALSFCDSRGLSMFIAAKEKAEAEGTALALRNLQPHVRHVFEISGIDRVLDIAD